MPGASAAKSSKDSIAGMISAVSQTVVGHPVSLTRITPSSLPPAHLTTFPHRLPDPPSPCAPQADTVKVRLQTDTLGRYRGPIHCLRCILRSDSIGGLYRGFASMLFGQQLVNIVKFSSYQHFRRVLNPEYRYMGSSHGGASVVGHRGWHVPAAAAASGFVNAFILCPVELVKVRLQAAFMTETEGHGARAAQGSLACARDLIATHGVARGLYSGLGATIARESVGVTCWLTGYETARRRLVREDGTMTLPRMALAGSCGGSSFWIVAFPLDTVKTRLQQQAFGTGPTGRVPYRGIADCLARIVREEGATSLYRGWSTSIFRAGCLVAPSIIVTYELARRVLD